MQKFLALLAALALFFGACGSDDDTSTADDSGADVTDGEAEGDDRDTGADDADSGSGIDDVADADDQARLDTALDEIDAAAVALGYTTERSPADDDSDDEDDLQFESDECKEADELFNRLDEEFPESASSESLDADRGDFTTPDSEVEQLNVELSSFPSTDDVDQAFEALSSVPLEDCMREAFEAESSEEFAVEIQSVDVTEGDRGDQELTIAIAATFSGGGVDIPVDLTFTFVGVDRHAVFFGSFAFNTSASDDAMKLLDTAVEALQ